MKKEKICLDTSVPSAYYDSRVKERQRETEKFWREIIPAYQVRVSAVTVEELANTRESSLRRKLQALIEPFQVLRVNARSEALARAYLEAGTIPERYMADALQIAIATDHQISYLVSWNFEHMVKVKTRREVNSINVLHGYTAIEIVAPSEL